MRLVYFLFRIYAFIFRPVLYGVRVLLIKGDQVLLVRHTYRSGWHLPGGGIKRNETPEAAARREAREETGAELAELRLIGIYSNFDENISGHNILFACEDFTMNGKHDNEIAEARFFPLDDLPKGLMPGHRRRLEEYRDRIEHPQFEEW